MEALCFNNSACLDLSSTLLRRLATADTGISMGVTEGCGLSLPVLRACSRGTSDVGKATLAENAAISLVSRRLLDKQSSSSVVAGAMAGVAVAGVGSLAVVCEAGVVGTGSSTSTISLNVIGWVLYLGELLFCLDMLRLVNWLLQRFEDSRPSVL